MSSKEARDWGRDSAIRRAGFAGTSEYFSRPLSRSDRSSDYGRSRTSSSQMIMEADNGGNGENPSSIYTPPRNGWMRTGRRGLLVLKPGSVKQKAGYISAYLELFCQIGGY